MGNIGRFFGAIWYWGSLKFLWGAQSIEEAANATYTSSVEGVGRAFDLEQEQIATDYKALRDAVAEVDTVLEERRDELQRLETEEAEVIGKRDGALTKYEEAKAAGDTEAEKRHEAAFQRFDTRIQQIDARQAELDGLIKQQQEALAGHYLTLTELDNQLANMPAEKAQAMADFVSNSKLLELRDRMNGARTRTTSGPIAAVRAKNKQLAGAVRVENKLRGTDVRAQDAEYAAAGKTSATGDRMQQMLAARKAKSAAATGDKPVVEAAPAERPEI